MTPRLLLTVLVDVDADASMLLSSLLVVSLVAAIVCLVLYALLARFAWHRPAPEAIIGSLSSGFAYAGNIEIMVSLYVLGSAVFTAPTILLQMAAFTPIALAILVTALHSGQLPPPDPHTGPNQRLAIHRIDG